MFLLGRWKNARLAASAEDAAGPMERSAAPIRAARRVRLDMRSKVPARCRPRPPLCSAHVRDDHSLGSVSDPRWAAVDRYVEELLVRPDDVLAEALAAGEAAGLPPAQVSASQG